LLPAVPRYPRGLRTARGKASQNQLRQATLWLAAETAAAVLHEFGAAS
jgi:hypothetical protein